MQNRALGLWSSHSFVLHFLLASVESEGGLGLCWKMMDRRRQCWVDVNRGSGGVACADSGASAINSVRFRDTYILCAKKLCSWYF